MNDRRWWWFLLALALAAIVLEVQWTRVVSWDEIEYFRATRWVAQGQLPYRDFWEHHLPLQWLVFAPAAIPLDGPGVSGPVWMRWMQIPFWIAIFAFGNAILARGGIRPFHRAFALVLLLTARFFYGAALEYRVDTLGTFFYIAAIAVVWLHPSSRRAWFGFGALMSAAVLANMRLAPFVAATAVLLAFVDGVERRWRWNRQSLWMIPAVAIVGAMFVGILFATGSWQPFLDAMQFNIATDRMVKGVIPTFWPVVFSIFRAFDAGAIAMWILAIAGGFFALREIRKPGVLQLLALLSIISLLAVRSLGVHYSYHFELSFLLMAPIAANLPGLERYASAAMIGLALLLAINLGLHIDSRPHRVLVYEDTIMREADRVTRPQEKVWDGVGYALRRPSAYKYWFLPAGVRELARVGGIPRYDAPQMMADPPAAIVYNTRVHFWFQVFPRAALYATRHYIPRYRNLWIPGLTALLGPQTPFASWIVPKSGRYRVYASELLAKHPWFSKPLKYSLVSGPDAPLYEVDVRKLPLVTVPVSVDGVPVDASVLDLKRDSVVRVDASVPLGVMIVPERETTFFTAPEEQLY